MAAAPLLLRLLLITLPSLTFSAPPAPGSPTPATHSASVSYCGELQRVRARDASAPDVSGPGASPPPEASDRARFDARGGLAVLREVRGLHEWVTAHGKSPLLDDPDVAHSAVAAALCDAAAAAARARGLVSGGGSGHACLNFIARDTATSAGNFTAEAHRDLDEDAAANLRASTGREDLLNFWVPLEPVERHTLGAVLPASVDYAADPAAFASCERAEGPGGAAGARDRTGLRRSQTAGGHRWVFFGGLAPGDAVVWRSDVVYHAALLGLEREDDASAAPPRGPSGASARRGRRSVDLRIAL
jgi:hypothetical protein